MGRCYNSVVVSAPSDTVWETVRNFHDMSWAPGVITSCEAVGESRGDQIGARRILNDAFHETLLALDPGARELSYSIDDGPGPVARDAVDNYVGRLRVLPITDNNNSFVEWESTYDSADEGAVGEFCNPIYQALLNALKEHFS